MMKSLAILLTFQLLGEIFVRAVGSSIPGPVVGILLLALGIATLKARFPEIYRQLEITADTLLANLGLLFVPAGVGIIQQRDLIVQNGFGLFFILLVSTLVTLAVTVWAFVLTRKFLSRGRENG